MKTPKRQDCPEKVLEQDATATLTANVRGTAQVLRALVERQWELLTRRGEEPKQPRSQHS